MSSMDVGKTCWFAVFVIGTLPAQDWPTFRGPAGLGVSSAKGVPTVWSAEKNVRWKVPLARPANGSPIVSNGCVFLTYAEDAEGKERSLYCFDRATGKQLWKRSVSHDKKMPTHRTNPYGGSTPAADGERVVVWHASAGLYCYDFKGKELWSHNFGEYRHRWGYGTSPVLHKGRVILHTGPGRQVFVIAMDVATGKFIWRHMEPVYGDGQDNAAKRYMGSWCTPIVVEVAGKEQVLCTMSTRLLGFDIDSGEVLWSCQGLAGKRGDLAYSSPVVVGDICSVLAGYEGPELGVRLGGKGDVTKTHRLWRHDNRPDNIGSGVAVAGKIYLPDARGFVVCLDPVTGKRLWSARPAKGLLWSSVVFVDDHLFVTNQRGTTVVFEPNPKKCVVVALNELGETTNSTPAFAGSEIFIRTHKHLYCIHKSPPAKKLGGK